MKIPLIDQIKNFYIIKKITSIVKTVIKEYDIKKTSIIILFLAMTYVLIFPILKLLTKIFSKNHKTEKSSSHRKYKKLSSSFCSNSSCTSSTCDSSSSSDSSSTKKCKKNKCKKIKLTKEEVKKTLRNYKLN
jgi:hypothetical protein